MEESYENLLAKRRQDKAGRVALIEQENSRGVEYVGVGVDGSRVDVTAGAVIRASSDPDLPCGPFDELMFQVKLPVDEADRLAAALVEAVRRARTPRAAIGPAPVTVPAEDFCEFSESGA